jgi:glucose/mannose-6-phosphate isomerase
MNVLDNPQEIKGLDKSNMIGSLKSLGKQLDVSFREARALSIPAGYKAVKNIVVTGMGGSGLGPHFIRSVFDVSLPMQVVNDYKLPSFVDGASLVIASSYSGNTEETLSAFGNADQKQAKIVGIAAGGKLVELLKRKNLPFYQFDPKYNVCGQPRMGLGYSIGGILGLLKKLEFANFSEADLENVLETINRASESFSIESPPAANPAKDLATKLVGKIPIILAADFLAGNAHIFANQTNENAKVFAAYFLLPEINHHLLEGTKFPESLGQTIKAVFLETSLYSQKVQTRIKVTKDVLEKAGVELVSYQIKATNKTQAAFETLAFSSWASFYLAVAYGIDPTPIPNVDYFKDQLAKFA